MALDNRVISLAVRSGGVVSRRMLLDEGRSRHWIDREVRAGRLSVIRPGIYRVVDMTDHDSLLRAALVALPNAVVSHQSAAFLHEFPRFEQGTPTVTVPSHTTHVFPGVEVHRTGDLIDDHVTVVNGMRATDTNRTIFDLAGTLPGWMIDRLVEDLVLAKRLDLPEFADFRDGLARRGKPGSVVTAEVIDKRLRNGGLDATALERLGLQTLREGGVPDPVLQYPAPWNSEESIDAVWPPARFGVEWDSVTWHGSLKSMSNDRRRDREAASMGWLIVRYTHQDLVKRRGAVVREVLGFLAARQP
jgi:hypothetical protein